MRPCKRSARHCRRHTNSVETFARLTRGPIWNRGNDKVCYNNEIHVQPIYNGKPEPLNRQLAYEENFSDDEDDAKVTKLAMKPSDRVAIRKTTYPVTTSYAVNETGYGPSTTNSTIVTAYCRVQGVNSTNLPTVLPQNKGLTSITPLCMTNTK